MHRVRKPMAFATVVATLFAALSVAAPSRGFTNMMDGTGRPHRLHGHRRQSQRLLLHRLVLTNHVSSAS